MDGIDSTLWQTYWRPWEDSFLSGKVLEGDAVTDERIIETPIKPYFSSVVSSPSPRPTQSRVYRRIWKRLGHQESCRGGDSDCMPIRTHPTHAS